MNKNNMSFTKEHTQIAKGIAILFMVYHHLFVIPERLNNEYINLLDINGVNFQSIIANFCKICVCIYIFLSGYGFFLSLKNTNSILQMYKKVGVHALKFMSNYWIIVLIELLVGTIIGKIKINLEIVINAIFGIVDGVAEFWFIQAYIVMLLIAPILVILLSKKQIITKILTILLLVIIYLIVRVLLKYDYIDDSGIFASYFWQIENLPIVATFFMGMLCSKFDIYKKVFNNRAVSNHIVLFSVLCLIFVVSFRIIFCNSPTSMKFDFLLAPVFVFAFTTLVCNNKLSKIMRLFGKHSTNIWLTHTFWWYYYFQNIVLLPKVSLLIFVWLIILSLFTSYIINILYIPLYNRVFSKRRNFSYQGYFAL